MRSIEAYSVLGVQPGVSLREAQAAYHELAKVHHPDAGGKAERFREIQSAYARIRPLASSGGTPVHIDVYA